MRRLFEAGEFRRHRARRASLALVTALAGLCIILMPLPVRADDAKAEATAFMKSGVEAVERGVYDRAVSQFSKALGSGGLSVEETALAWHHRGVAFQKMGQREAAIGDYTKAIESGALPAKVLPKAYYNRARKVLQNATISRPFVSIPVMPRPITTLPIWSDAEAITPGQFGITARRSII